MLLALRENERFFNVEKSTPLKSKIQKYAQSHLKTNAHYFVAFFKIILSMMENTVLESTCA